MITKKTNNIFILSLLVIDLIIMIITEPILSSIHGGIFNNYEEGMLEPIFYGSLPLLASLMVLNLTSQKEFKTWLLYIASWYVPLSIFFISQISVYSSFILSIDRTTAALYWMSGLCVITVGFVVVQKYILNR